MKKTLTFLFLSALGFSTMSQSIVTTTPQYKTAVLEEYTGIYCGWCPAGHKIAKELHDKYGKQFIAINIHQGSFASPSGSDPDYKTQWGDQLAQQAGVTGYPSGTVNRHVFPSIDQNMALNRGSWEAATELTIKEVSPANVGITSTYNQSTNELTIQTEVYYTSNSSASKNYLNIALLQDGLEGPQSGSNQNPDQVLSNGKYRHDHMLRDMITGQWGEEITSTSKGDLFTKTYTYQVPNDVNGIPLDITKCHLVGFIAEDQKNIYTGTIIEAVNGASDGNIVPFYGVYENLSTSIQGGSSGEKKVYAVEFNPSIDGDTDYEISLSSDAPIGWKGNFEVDGTAYTTTTLSMTGGNKKNIKVNVIPGNKPALAKYSLKIIKAGETGKGSIQEIYAISGIYDLVVNGSGGNGKAEEFEQLFIDGLVQANNGRHAKTSAKVMTDGLANNSLDGIRNIYLNIGWSFPSYTDDEANKLKDFLDNGGNLFISGQDIGWDQESGHNQANGTVVTKAFYTDYLHAKYEDDGSQTRNQFKAVSSDAVFGSVPDGNVIDKHNNNMYPDKITPLNGASKIFTYNNSTDVAGIRYKGTYKVVYLGVGLEMIQSDAVRNEVLKTAHDWFYEGTGVDYSGGDIVPDNVAEVLKAYNIYVYPNPASTEVKIETGKFNQSEVSILNATGQVVRSISTTQNVVILPLNELKNGYYFLRLINDKTSITTPIIIEK